MLRSILSRTLPGLARRAPSFKVTSLKSVLPVFSGVPHRFYTQSDEGHYFGGASVRKPAPNFKATALIGENFEKITLDQYTSKGQYVVLFFYPLDFTFVCPTEILAFNEKAKEFEALNTQLLGVSVDSVFSHLAWTKQPKNKGGIGPLNFPLISDITKSISAEYGVLTSEDDSDPSVSLRGLFIIDNKGVLRSSIINDLPIGRSVSETLRLVKAIQHHEKHGEVCPADWAPGKDAMKAGPKESLPYFEKHGK